MKYNYEVQVDRGDIGLLITGAMSYQEACKEAKELAHFYKAKTAYVWPISSAAKRKISRMKPGQDTDYIEYTIENFEPLANIGTWYSYTFEFKQIVRNQGGLKP